MSHLRKTLIRLKVKLLTNHFNYLTVLFVCATALHTEAKVLYWPDLCSSPTLLIENKTALEKAVWLVDDVLTSGATARACAQILRRAGARSVRMAVAAVADLKSLNSAGLTPTTPPA